MRARPDTVLLAAAYVEQMAADHEAAAVHLLASPHRGTGAARDEAQIRGAVAENLWTLSRWLRDQAGATS